MPGAYVQYVRFEGDAKGGNILNERRFQGSLFTMIPTLETFVGNAVVMQRPVAVSLFKEKDVINYPEKALRELMMNACMHRDYQSNMPVRLYQFDNYVEIMNPGGLYGEARPENFPYVNDYRNPVVAEAMKEMKYVNMFNQGISRVQNMLADNGNKKAEFDVSKLTVFGVTVYSNFEEKYDVSQGVSQGVTQGDADVTQGVPQSVTNVPRNVTNDNPENTVVDTSNGDDEQNGVTNDVPQGVSQDVPQGVSQGVPEEYFDTWIIEQIKGNSKITVKELAQISGFHERTIYRHVAKLPYIKYIGSGYSGHWEVEG